MKRTFNTETWIKIGQPDLGSKIFFKIKGKKIYGKVNFIQFGYKKGIRIGIEKFKK